MALILVGDDGENVIAVVPGANDSVLPGDLAKAFLEKGDVVLLQHEIPLQTVDAALDAARAAGAVTVLNTAPFRGEAAALARQGRLCRRQRNRIRPLRRGAVAERPRPRRRACATSPSKTGRTIVVTLGGDGVLAATPDDFLTVPALKITPVDTVGAGDTFCGYFAAGLSSGLPLEQALAPRRRRRLAGLPEARRPAGDPAGRGCRCRPRRKRQLTMTMRPATKHAVPPAGDICRLSAVELADAIRRRRLSVREVVTAFLDRIEAVNPLVNAIVSLRDRADILREADAADAHLARGEPAGSLFGLPIAIKDLA